MKPNRDPWDSFEKSAVSKKLRHLQHIPYADAKDAIRTSDLYFEHGPGWAEFFIQLQAVLHGYSYPVAHVGIFRQDGLYLMGMEAVMPCSRQVRFSAIREHHHEAEYVWCRPSLDESSVPRFEDTAKKFLGTVYDLPGIGEFVLQELEDRNGTRKELNLGAGKNKLFCSEYVALTAMRTGLKLSPIAPRKLSPSQLLYDGISRGTLQPMAIIIKKGKS